jgi:phenacrylate decarboxylase
MVQVNQKRLIEIKITPEIIYHQIKEIIFSFKPSQFIDPSDLRNIIWAKATTSHPQDSDFFMGNYPTYNLVPYATHGLNSHEPQAKVVRLCILPAAFMTLDQPWIKASFHASYPEEVKKRVLDNWRAYGFDRNPVGM